MKSVDQHLADVLAAVHPLPPLPLPLVDAHGCTLGEDVVATNPLPGFDNSAMDGYAVRVEDVASATPETPVTLPVVGDIAAGSNTGISIRPGFTARIMTGAPIPPGADAVVQLEWTDGGKTSVVITQAPHPGQHVRRAGEDLAEGALVLPAGTYLGAAQIGLLAAANRASAMCRPRPRVVIVSTGTELVNTGDPLGPGQLPDSNSHMLAAACREAGAIAYRVGLVRDDPALLLQTLEDHLIRADMLLTSGGVSVGAYDVVKEVLTRLGTVAFDKVAMQPGMPQGFGTLGPERIPIVTLPGNPVSAMVSFEVFVRPSDPPHARGERAAAASGHGSGRGGVPLTGREALVPAGYRRAASDRPVDGTVGGRAGFPSDGGAGRMQCAADDSGGADPRGARRFGARSAAGAEGRVTEGSGGSSPRLTHVDEQGAARMVDVGDKEVTTRVAVAAGRLLVSPAVLELLRGEGVPKGDALGVARVAGILAAKRTPDLVPLCHPLPISGVEVELELAADAIEIRARVKTKGRTGVEMEALTSVAVAGLTLHDMVKAVDPAAVLTDVRVLSKSGGRSGDWARGDAASVPAAHHHGGADVFGCRARRRDQSGAPERRSRSRRDRLRSGAQRDPGRHLRAVTRVLARRCRLSRRRHHRRSR